MVKYNTEGDLLFSCAKDDTPTVWLTSTGERLGTYDGHQGVVWHLDVSKDSSRLLTAGGDQSVKLWEVSTGKLLASFNQAGSARVAEWAENADMFLVVSDPFSQNPAEVRIYQRKPNTDAEDESAWEYTSWTTQIVGPGKRISKATWGPMNEYVVTGDDAGVIRIHDPRTGEVKREIREHSKKINSFQWNNEKTLLISGSADCTAKLFDVATWRSLRTFETEVPVNAAAISPIKEHVFVAGGQEAMNVTTTSLRTGKFETKLFHMVFGDEFGSVRGHFGPVNTIALHPDGTGFTSGSEDGYIRVHNFDKDYFTMHNEFDDLDALLALTKGVTASD